MFHPLTIPAQPRPDLSTSLPVTPSGPGWLAVEAVIPRGGNVILDIVTAPDAEVLGWCCFARERGSSEWFRVEELRKTDHGDRHPISVPGADVQVWGFHRFERASLNENIWRIHGKNLASTENAGRDVCLRLVVAVAAALPVRAFPRIRRTMKARANSTPPRRPWDPAPSHAFAHAV